MSLNLCTDQLLMALVPPGRIVSISGLSRTEGDPAQRALAWRLPANRGSAEEVLRERPDLVLAGRFTTPATRALLQRVGVPLVEVDSAEDWEGIRRITREVARVLGAEARAEALLADMEADLAWLAARPRVNPPRVLGWSGTGDSVPGAGTLFDAIVTAAGARNVATEPGAPAGFDLEQVLRARPDVLLRGAAYSGAPAWRNDAALHRVLRRHYTGRLLTYPEAVYGCGVPRAAALARELAVTLDGLAMADAHQ